MFWGFSEALDLFEEYRRAQDPEEDAPTNLNILLFGVGDPRHVLKTIAKSYKHSTRLNFFLLEGCLELVARNLLLTTIALEDGQLLSAKGRTHLYMDVFGNALVRPFSSGYISAKARVLARQITDPEFAERIAPIFSVDGLKYRERDQLGDVFRFWTNSERHVFNAAVLWDARVRAMLGTRYDSKMGAFDWDYHMRLRENGAKQVCAQEYKHWRDCGIAFTFPEYEQSDANKTFAVGLNRDGDSFVHRGFVGDITTGPFISFGVKCSDPSFTHSQHGINEFRATDVTERNVYELMYEIQERKPCELDSKDVHKYGSYVLGTGKNLNKDQVRTETIEACKYDEPLIACESSKINFLSVESVLNIQTKADQRNKYDIVIVANNYFSFLKEDFSQLFKENALICFETRQYTTFTKEEITKFTIQIKDFAKTLSLKPLTNFDINVPYSLIRYRNISQAQ